VTLPCYSILSQSRVYLWAHINMAVRKVDIDVFLRERERVPVLDVRSPGEYAEGHLISALSFPLFTDEERKIIGTLYKQEGKKPAIKKGLDITGPKMKGFIEEAEALKSETLALYCWRGGMRSGSMAWLLDQYGFNVLLLEGGYKTYRKRIVDFFEQPLPLQVLTGYTGSKKTHLLHLLGENGEQIVDIEALARHQGSSFGNQKSTSQPTTEQFQNLLFEEFRKLDLTKPVWVEDENMKIGRVNMPEGLHRQKNTSPHVFLEIDKGERVAFLMEDYGNLTVDQLVSATESISRKLGRQNTDEAIEYIRQGDLGKAAEIILTYYDARYHKSISGKKHLIREHVRISMKELKEVPKRLIRKQEHEV